MPPRPRPTPTSRRWPFPNPEEPGALDLAIARRRCGSMPTSSLANDPDADRLAVAVPDEASGGVASSDRRRARRAPRRARSRRDERRRPARGHDDRLVVDAFARSPQPPASPTRDAHGLQVDRESGAAPPGHRFVFGYEEALGYAVSDAVADKDGLSAALVAASCAARAKARGASLLDAARRPRGQFRGARDRAVVAAARGPGGAGRDAEARRSLARDPPAALGRARGHRGRGPGTRGPTACPHRRRRAARRAERARVVVRPSGTEPKLKAYFEVVTPPLPPGRRPRRDASARPVPRALREDVAARCEPAR